MIPGCRPGYGCLTCDLPAEACEHSGAKVFNEERQMILAVGRETMEHSQKPRNKRADSAGTESARRKNLG